MPRHLHSVRPRLYILIARGNPLFLQSGKSCVFFIHWLGRSGGLGHRSQVLFKLISLLPAATTNVRK